MEQIESMSSQKVPSGAEICISVQKVLIGFKSSSNTDEMDQKYTDEFNKIIDYLHNLQNPLKWTQIQHDLDTKDLGPKMTLMVMGEIGNGKSTLMNYIRSQYNKMYNVKQSNLDNFKTGFGGESVTKTVNLIQDGNLLLIDSPGVNDPSQGGVSDSAIAKGIAECVNKKFGSSQQGLTAIVQAITIDKVGGRLRDSGIKAMAAQIQSLTTCYHNAKVEQQPSVYVVFTGTSKKYLYKKKLYEKFINDYHNLLAERLSLDFGVSRDKQDIKKIIQTILPSCNFTAYEIDADFADDDDDNLEGLKEIQNFVESLSQKPQFYIDCIYNFEPVHLSQEARDVLTLSLTRVIESTNTSIVDSQNFFNQHASTQSNVIKEAKEKAQKHSKQINDTIRNSPWVYAKAYDEVRDFIDEYNNRINIILHNKCVQEIFKINKDKAKEMQKEQDKLQEEIKALKKKGDDNGCFSYGTMFNVLQKNNTNELKAIENLKVGDMICVHPFLQKEKNQLTIKLDHQKAQYQPIVYIEDHGISSAIMVSITLQNNEVISISQNHYLPTIDKDSHPDLEFKGMIIKHKEAKDITIYDSLVQQKEGNQMQAIEIKNIVITFSNGASNIVLNGYPLISKERVLASIRTKDDGPDLMWKMGEQIFLSFGPYWVEKFCQVGIYLTDDYIYQTIISLFIGIFLIQCMIYWV